MMPTRRRDLSSSEKHLWKYLYKYGKGCVSIMSLNLVTLTMTMNFHKFEDGLPPRKLPSVSVRGSEEAWLHMLTSSCQVTVNTGSIVRLHMSIVSLYNRQEKLQMYSEHSDVAMTKLHKYFLQQKKK